MLAKIPRAGAALGAFGFAFGCLAMGPTLANGVPFQTRIGASSANLRGMRIGARPHGAPAPSYTIHNFGAPGGYDSSSPSGFNNTGQIFGQARRSLLGGGSVADCVVWSAGVFRRVPVTKATTYGTGCTANGINDADTTTGQYEVVGSATEEFALYAHAFAAVAGPAGFTRATTYYAYAPSTMVGVNAAQLSLAAAYSDRDTAVDLYGQLYSTTKSASGSLTLLQALPAITDPVLHALGPSYQNPCPFGGCAINDRNEVLGYDTRTENGISATVALFTVGQPSSLVHVPLQDSVPSDNPQMVTTPNTYPVAFNDRDELLYLDATLNLPAIYNVDTGQRTIVPASGPTCINPIPISMNDLGEMLGSFQYCATPTYFTWDPVHGTQYLNAQLPPSADTIVPLGVNDSGQILVALISSASITSWGTLDPVASAPAKVRLRKRSVSQQ